MHGCDHLCRELAEMEAVGLCEKVKLATVRMNAHQVMTGLKFEKVMLFPQGILSKTAIKIPRNKNYIAAVNSTATAVGGGHRLVWKDSLTPAIMQ